MLQYTISNAERKRLAKRGAFSNRRSTSLVTRALAIVTKYAIKCVIRHYSNY